MTTGKKYKVQFHNKPEETFHADGFIEDRSCIVFYENIKTPEGVKRIKQNAYIKKEVSTITCILV